MDYIPPISDLFDAMQDFVETVSFDEPAPPDSPDPDDTVMKGLSVVFKANPYRDAAGRWSTKDGAATTSSLASDLVAQHKWLTERAKEAGKANLDEWLSSSPEQLMDQAKLWRRYHTFKYNDAHDNKGRFTFKDKATHHFEKTGQAIEAIHAGLKNDPSYMDTAAGKAKIKEAATSYVKYAKNKAAGFAAGQYPLENSTAVPHETLVDVHAKGSPAIAAKLKASVTATKAATKIAQNHAMEKLASPEMKEQWQAALTGDKKAAAYVQQTSEHLKQQFLKNGGDAQVWTEAQYKLAAGTLQPPSKAISSKTVLTPTSGATKPSEADLKPSKAIDSTTVLKPDLAKTTVEAVQAQTSAAAVKLALPADLKVGNMGHDDIPKKAWAEPNSAVGDEADKKASALSQNHELGMVYYLKRQVYGQSDPETTHAYSEWQKSKDYLTNNHGVSKDEIGKMSLASKTAVENVEAENKKAMAAAANAKLNALQPIKDSLKSLGIAAAKGISPKYASGFNEADLNSAIEKATAAGMTKSQIDALVQFGKDKGEEDLYNEQAAAYKNVKASSALYAQFKDHPVQKISDASLQGGLDKALKEAAALGVPQNKVDGALNDGTEAGKEALAKQKAEALTTVTTAAYSSGMKKSAGGTDYTDAKHAYDDAKKAAAAYGYDKAAIDKAAIQGTAKAVGDDKKLKKLMAAMGDIGKTAAVYDGPDFKPLDFMALGEKGFASYAASKSGNPELVAHLDRSQAAFKSLSMKEQNAIENHLGGGYSGMNKGSNPHVKGLVADGLMKVELGTDMTVRRNTAQKWVWQALGVPESEWSGKAAIPQAKLDSFVGKPYMETATISSTKRLDSTFVMQSTASQSGMASMMIRMNKHIHALDTNLGSGASSSEAEVTIAPNLTMVIRKITYTGNTSNTNGKPRYIFDVDAIGHLGTSKTATVL